MISRGLLIGSIRSSRLVVRPVDWLLGWLVG